MAITTQERTNILKLVVGMFNAAPGAEYLNEFVGAYDALGKSYDALATALGNTGAFKSLYPASLTNEESATKFLKTLGLEGNTEAQEWVVAKLNAGEAMSSVILQALVAIIETTSPDFADAQALLNNKAVVAEYYSVTLGQSADDLGTLQGVVANVKADSDVSTPEKIAELIGGEIPVANLELTVNHDTIVGTSGDDVITAGLSQFGGVVYNTWASNDKIDGGEGHDVFNATLTSEVTGSFAGLAIDANLKNVEEVHIRAQSANLDLLGNGLNNIDAGEASGVQEWWSDNSRSTVVIEDIRSRPENTTFGMKQTDPLGHGMNGVPVIGPIAGGLDGTAFGPSLIALFDPAQLTNTIDNSNSSLTLRLHNNADPASELAAFSLDKVGFTLGGKEYILEDLGSPATYADLVAALQTAVAAEPDLAGVTVTLNADNTVTLTDVNQGREFVGLGYGWAGGLQPPAGQLEWDLIVGKPVQEEVPIKTTIILDEVGRTSQGGSVQIGSFSNVGGIEQFDVKVDGSSWVTGMTSTNNTLETVNVTHLNAGDTSHLYIGYSTREGQAPNGNPGTADYATTTDDRLTASPSPLLPFSAGIVDVRTFNAAGFTGELKVGAALTDASIDKYLIGAKEPVQFTYTLGDANSNLSLFVDNALSADPDFALDIIGGLGDDRVNLTGAATKRAITIDGGAGFNTLEVDTSVGTTAANSFESVTNIQKLVVAGAGGATIDFDDGKLTGVEEVWVATEANGSTTLRDLQASVDTVYVSGKNQTLGVNASDNNQYQGVVTVTNAAAAALTVVLDNTARLDGLLDVDQLTIDGATSAVRTLEIVSDGGRQTTNEIDQLDALRVNTFNLTGTQDLKVYINSASNYTAALPADRDSLTVDGSELTGDLHLLINPDLATTIDGTVDRTNTFTGTDGANDVLQFTNNYADPSLLYTTTNTKISGFETLVFGDHNGSEYQGGVEGSFNNGATTGVKNYFVDHFHGDTVYRAGVAGVTDDDRGLELINLGDKAKVGVFTGDSYIGAGETALTLRSSGVLSEVDVNLTHTAYGTTTKTYDIGDWNSNQMNLEVGGYKTINLNLDAGTNTGAQWLDYGFDLVLLDRNGLQKNEANFVKTGDIAANWATQGVAARELVVTGGNAAARNGDVSHSDELDLYNLDAALDTIDLSGYHGQVWGSIDAMYQDKVTDVTVVVGSSDIDWDVNTSTAVGQGYNTTFEFTAKGAGFTNVPGNGNAAATWTIKDFVATANVNAGTINSHTILDVSGLGITAYNQLRVEFVGGDTWIHSEAEALAGNGYSWEIKLAGADYSAAGTLGIAENFKFA